MIHEDALYQVYVPLPKVRALLKRPLAVQLWSRGAVNPPYLGSVPRRTPVVARGSQNSLPRRRPGFWINLPTMDTDHAA